MEKLPFKNPSSLFPEIPQSFEKIPPRYFFHILSRLISPLFQIKLPFFYQTSIIGEGNHRNNSKHTQNCEGDMLAEAYRKRDKEDGPSNIARMSYYFIIIIDIIKGYVNYVTINLCPLFITIICNSTL